MKGTIPDITFYHGAHVAGAVFRQESPCGKLVLFNYTPETQFSRNWNDVTLTSRGIIFEKDSGSIIARPFPKFFNMEEHAQEDMPEIPNEEFEVYEKLDGSLGIIYWYDFQWNVATRGSFSSEQAIEGEKMLRNMYDVNALDPQFTYLVEIIYPENRIVVDYQGERKLVLLAVIDTASGREESIDNWSSIFPLPRRYNYSNFNQIKSLDWENHEGVVIRFKSGFRMKIKFENYIYLHRIMTETTPKRIFEAWAAEVPISDNLEGIPDEIFNEIEDWETKFSNARDDILIDAYQNWFLPAIDGLNDPKKSDRREFAERAKSSPYPGILFTFLDGKDVTKGVNRLVYQKFFS